MKLYRAATVLASAVLGTLALAPAAQAGTSGCSEIKSPTGVWWSTTVEVCFQDYGEKLSVSDTYADGKSAIGYISYDGMQGTPHYWNPNGEGTTRTFDFSIPEGTSVTVKACRGNYKDLTTVGCNAGTTFTA